MPSIKKSRHALGLTLLLLITSCASTPPSPLVVKPVQIPPPPVELMTPETTSLPDVPGLLSFWTKQLEDWRARKALCRHMPAKCA